MGIASHFLLELAESKYAKKRLFYLIAYVPPILFLYQLFFDTLLVQDLVYGPLGWTEVLAINKVWFIIFSTYTTILLFWGLYALLKRAGVAQSKRERHRILLIVKTGALTAFLGIMTNFVFPLLNLKSIPALAPVFLIIFILGAFYAIVKYRIMSIDLITTADNILQMVGDMVLLLNNKLTIVRCNKSFCDVFNYSEAEVIDRSIDTFFPELIGYIGNKDKNSNSIELTLKTKDNYKIPVAINIMRIEDKYGDKIGNLLVFNDLRTLYRLKAEIEHHKQTQNELLDLQKNLEIKVEEKTARLVELNRKLMLSAQQREQLYNEILKTEEKFKKVIEFYPDPVGVLNKESEVTYANQPFAKLLGLPKIREMVDTYCAEQINGVLTDEVEIDGRFVHLTLFSIPGSEGERVMVLKDITEIKQREVELKKAYERYHQILEEVTDGYYETDLRGRFVFFNRSWLRLLEIPGEELLGASYKKVVPKEHWKEVFAVFNRAFVSKARIEAIRLSYVTPKGTFRELEISISPILNELGDVVGFRGMGRDITEKVRQEELLKESEERFRSLFETIKYPILIMEGQTFIDCNPAAEKVFKATRDQIIGKTPFDFSPEFQPDGEESVRKGCPYIEMALKGEVASFEWTHRRADGSLFDTEVTLHGMTVNERPYLIAMVYDLTERKRLEERLRLSSITDELTGLYNRRGFLEMGERMLKAALRLNKGIFLIFIDLNGLKLINDTYGHQAGDMALRGLAKVLKSIFRETDIVARIGGDEFILLAMESEETMKPESVIRRIEEAVALKNQDHELPFDISVSIGVTRWNPGSDLRIEDLIAEADRLMYLDKAKKYGVGHGK